MSENERLECRVAPSASALARASRRPGRSLSLPPRKLTFAVRSVGAALSNDRGGKVRMATGAPGQRELPTAGVLRKTTTSGGR